MLLAHASESEPSFQRAESAFSLVARGGAGSHLPLRGHGRCPLRRLLRLGPGPLGIEALPSCSHSAASQATSSPCQMPSHPTASSMTSGGDVWDVCPLCSAPHCTYARRTRSRTLIPLIRIPTYPPEMTGTPLQPTCFGAAH